jgi:tetratricopeptide (TPR) repeat protein
LSKHLPLVILFSLALGAQSYDLKTEKDSLATIESAAATGDGVTLVRECNTLLADHRISALAWFRCGKYLLSVKTTDLKEARSNARTAYHRLERATKDFSLTGKQLYLALDGLQYMGLAAMLLGDYDRAQVHFRAVLARDNRMAAAWYNLGVVYEMKGLNDEAMRSFDRYLRLVGAGKDTDF